MKRITIVWVMGVLCVLLFSVLGCANTKALDHNNVLIGFQTKVIEKMMDLTTTFEKHDHAVMLAKLKELDQVIVQSIASVTQLKGFEGDTSLRNVVLELLQFYKDISGKEYLELINILGREGGPITQVDVDRINEINQDISNREILLDEKMGKVQQAFAKKYKFELTRNGKQDEIDNLGKENK